MSKPAGLRIVDVDLDTLRSQNRAHLEVESRRRQRMIRRYLFGEEEERKLWEPFRKYVDRKELHELVQEIRKNRQDRFYSNLLIFDVRPKSEFLKSHIDHPDCVCVPSEFFRRNDKNGLSLRDIGERLYRNGDVTAWRVWKKLWNAHKVVIYDRDSRYEHPSPALRSVAEYFLNMAKSCDSYKPAAILNLGILCFSSDFPHLVTSAYNEGELRNWETPVSFPPVIQSSSGFRLMDAKASLEVAEKHLDFSKIRMDLGWLGIKGFNMKAREKRKPTSPVRTERPRKSPAASWPPLTTKNINANADTNSSSNPRLAASTVMVLARGKNSVPRGITNLGNTCYMNVVFQCLNMTTGFLEAIVRFGIRDSSPWSIETLAVLQQLRSTVDTGSLNILNVKNLARKHSKFGGQSQEDSCEFLSFLLEAIDSEASTLLEKNMPTRVQEIFEFGGIITLACPVCGKSRKKDPVPGMISSLIIPAGKSYCSITDCLEASLRHQKVETSICPICQTGIEMHSMKFGWLPPVLMIQLQRFRTSKQLNAEKVLVRVQVPFTLDLTKYCDSSMFPVPQTPSDVGGATLPSVGVKYELFAVINHHGMSVNSGHYTAYGKNTAGIWYKFDDQQVATIGKQPHFSQQDEQDCYIMFLKKKS